MAHKSADQEKEPTIHGLSVKQRIIGEQVRLGFKTLTEYIDKLNETIAKLLDKQEAMQKSISETQNQLYEEIINLPTLKKGKKNNNIWYVELIKGLDSIFKR